MKDIIVFFAALTGQGDGACFGVFDGVCDNIDENLADTVQKMWVNFARCGDPSTDTIHWEKYDKSRKTMIFDSETTMVRDPLSKQRKLLL